MIYRWGNAVKGFNLPVKVNVNGEELRLDPVTSWKMVAVEFDGSPMLTVNPNYYVGSFNLLGN